MITDRAYPHPPKIDIHVHATLRATTRRPDGSTYATPAELRQMYDQIGVQAGLLLPGVAPECSHRLTPNEDAETMIREYPETLCAWFCGIDPRWGRNSPESNLSQHILFYKEAGAKGIGEMTCHLDMTDPRTLNFFRHAAACAMPVTIHIGQPGFNDYGLVDAPGLPGLEQVLAENPTLIILGHSQNFWIEISGDGPKEPRNTYPKTPVLPGGRVVSLMRQYPGLHGDLSAGSGFNAISRDPAFGCDFLEEFQDRLYFGTDICTPRNITNPMLQLSGWLDDAVDQGKISKEAYAKICRGNAIRMLGLS